MFNQSFMLWCFITPIMGAIVAEQYIGRVKTIIYSSFIYSCGLVTLFISSLPFAQDRGFSLLALLSSLFMIGIGTGGIKANVSSLIAEQYNGPNGVIRVLKNGEKVVIDKDLTIQRFDASNKKEYARTDMGIRIFTTFFLFINIGSFAALASTALEQNYGFSAAFALPTAVFLVGFAIIWATQDHYLSNPPDGSIILNVCRALWIIIKKKGNINYARPAFQAEQDSPQRLPWDDAFIDDLKMALSACRVFLLYPFYWAAFSQFLTNFVSQGGTMETHGIPNDIMTYIDPVTTLILLPILDRIVFPLLRRLGFPVSHIHRITGGFIICGLSMLYAALIQEMIYAAPPCYDHPRALDCMDGKVPNKVSVFFQAPAYTLVAISEILASVAGIEYAYAKAPKSMRSSIMAIYLSTVSVGIFVAMAVLPLTMDPRLTWMYVILGIGTLLAGVVMWLSQL
jgi:POT family proton-dependent oligopeptide transporter